MKNRSRSAAVVLALFVLFAVHACGAGPPGNCSKRPEQGSCTGTSADGVLHWYFDEDEFLGWCYDGSSPNITIEGGDTYVEVDPETGEITIINVGGDEFTATCQP